MTDVRLRREVHGYSFRAGDGTWFYVKRADRALTGRRWRIIVCKGDMVDAFYAATLADVPAVIRTVMVVRGIDAHS